MRSNFQILARHAFTSFTARHDYNWKKGVIGDTHSEIYSNPESEPVIALIKVQSAVLLEHFDFTGCLVVRL